MNNYSKLIKPEDEFQKNDNTGKGFQPTPKPNDLNNKQVRINLLG